MGLIKAGVGAAAGVLADTWRDYFYCDALGAEELVRKAEQSKGKRGANTKGSDNLITNGSIIVVADGQCMILVDQGKVSEVCAEPGEFLYDASTEPSLFYGSLKETVVESFKKFGTRFAFGAETAHDQRVYFVNTKEIIGNKYGTASPVPFRVVDQNVGLDVDIAIKCFGEYSYKITDPVLFYSNVVGNVQDTFSREAIDGQLKSELLTALQPAFAKISTMGIRYSALPGHTTEIAEALNEALSSKWGEIRGLSVVSFGVSAVSASEEDEKMIKELQRNAAFRNPNMAAAHLVGAQAQAMQDAAKNENAGAMGAFLGMGMVNNTMGNAASNLFNVGQQQGQAPQAASAPTWTCSCGEANNTGKFCVSCGKPMTGQTPVVTAQTWTCGNCGHEGNTSKFCSECGTARPATYACDKCGWVPENPAQPPKFCPECGDPFDANDIK